MFFKGHFLLVLLLSATFFSLGAAANQVQFQEVGRGTLRYLFWEVYEASLETSSGKYLRGQHPMRFTLSYLREFTGDEISQATNEQWQRLKMQAYVEKWGKELALMWPDVKRGDAISMISDIAGGAHFYHNGRLIGYIDEAGFADAFIDIWLSPETATPDLRRDLIGGEE